jgi:restriction system protein
MAIPGFQELMLPVLREVASVEEMHTAELINRMAERCGVTAEECARLNPAGGAAMFANRTHWAIAYLKR